ncbi:MAG TPA: alpha-2-macroglobulin family protein, partial [Verrucomicrobiota bacterium]|nr:alpha-2-macroglobulin family protein [Verrucomicrobiota bacterium]
RFGSDPAVAPRSPDPATVTARRNLQETAFFLPQLVSDSNGVVRLTFTMPEALTEWRFLGFAHDRQLRSGLLEGRTVTAKELMVQPNPPRFLREGDEVEFTVKVSNQSAARQTGRVRLAFSFAQDGSPADAALGNAAPEQDFDIPAKESRSFGWRIKVPDGAGFLTFKATGTTGRLSDGEEGYLPVLSHRVFLTESLPLPIRGPGERRFTFASLKDSAASPSVRHESFTVQMVSNPAWYAVLALPYLMEFPHECSEQTFNRLYANLLARHVANSDPRIKAVFDQWRATPALDSPLEKNPELRNIALLETPWLRAAKDESQARRQVAVLFEGNRLDAEIAAAQRKLAEMHQEQGWPWFTGGPRKDYLTLYIITGFGRLRHLGAEADPGLALGALPGLDAHFAERHARLKKDGHLDRDNLDPHTALYLYGRSFF